MIRSVAVLAIALLVGSCSKSPAPASAYRITSRDQLVGGKRALGEIGDYKISNGVIHAIIQDIGFSRGFGAFGGSLIDVDLVRGGKISSATGPQGNDGFTEVFPAFFLQASEPSKVEVLSDGSDGTAAIIRVSGKGGDFLSIINGINDLLIPKVSLDYAVDYILEPGKQYLKMVITVTNSDTQEAQFPLAIPFGVITLLGEGQRLFVPGEAGFDIRFHLDEVYKRDTKIEALPGEVASMWATEGQGVSYAFAANPLGASYMRTNPTYYPGAQPDSLLIPIAYSSFLGSYWGKPPSIIAPKKSYSYSAYLAVGTGDVASAQKVIFNINDGEKQRQPVKTGTLSGMVTEDGTGAHLKDISVVFKNTKGEYVTQARTTEKGLYSVSVPPGKYIATAVEQTRTASTNDVPVEVTEGGAAQMDLTMERPGFLEVMVRDELGRALPSKISVEAIYDHSGADPARKFLFDLGVGERFRSTDLVPDDAAKPDSRRYLERVFFAHSGSGGRPIRAGHYKVFASRGPEYALASQEVDVFPGRTAKVELKVEHLLDTPGWISADFHVHSRNSVDSDYALEDRVASYAVEGVDLVTSTDHNYVTDFTPTVEALKLQDWLSSTVGLELTSLEMGHFNAYPIKIEPGPVTHGSFRWFKRPPGELFAQLRGLGTDPPNTIVQVNHPRDSILGYFNAFNIGSYSGVPVGPVTLFPVDSSPEPDGGLSPYDPKNFSLDFNAMEVFNGKRDQLIFTYKIPQVAPPGKEPGLKPCMSGQEADCLPAPGEVLMVSAKKPLPDGGVQLTPQPAFPGAMDDWFTMLGHQQKVTATGNSDSHSASAEAGLPRTYLEVGETANGSMRGLSEGAAMAAIREGRGICTNGPFLQVKVNGQGIGAEVVAPTGEIEVEIVVKAVPWVDVKRVRVRRGGKDQGRSPEVLETIPVTTEATKLERLNVKRKYTNISDDSFIVIEVEGDESMYPVFTPYEVPSIEISDAVGVIGGSFGFSDKYGKFRPQPVQQVNPYAFSNPIWVRRSAKQSLQQAPRVLPVSNFEPFQPRTMPDLRKLFGNFHADVE